MSNFSLLRGRDGTLGPSMIVDPGQFAEFDKFSDTPTIDDDVSAVLDSANRDILRDYGSQKEALFSYEEPMRENQRAYRIRLREEGRYSDPYKDDDFDIQFHDKDPRGWSGETPWGDMRKQSEARSRQKKQYADESMHVPESTLGPTAMFNNIRSTQNWLKARWKNFDESYNNRSNGGVGVYGDVSRLDKSALEMPEGTIVGEDPINRANVNIIASNNVHLGSKYFVERTTTDHKIKTSAYGKLLRSNGLIPHGAQMREMSEGDIRKREEMTTTSRQLVKHMRSAMRGDTAETMRAGKSVEGRAVRPAIVMDILSIIGVSERDIRAAESMSNKNNTMAKHAVAELKNLVEMVQRMPVSEQMRIRDDLMLRSAGAHLKPKKGSASREALVKPVAVEHMINTIRTAKSRGESGKAAWESNATQRAHTSMELFTSGALTPGSTSAAWESEASGRTHASREVRTYRDLAKSVNGPSVDAAALDMPLPEYFRDRVNETLAKHHGALDQYNGEVDIDFGDNHAKSRHVGPLGHKSIAKYKTDREYYSEDKTESETTHRGTRRPKNTSLKTGVSGEESN